MPLPKPPLATMPSGESPGIAEVFATETMAELYVRQGREPEAVAIYRRLLASPASPDPQARHPRWLARLKDLEAVAGAAAAAAAVSAPPQKGMRDVDLRTLRAIESMAAQLGEPEPAERERPSRPSRHSGSRPPEASVPAPALPPAAHRLPLVVEEPVRSGQMVYAEGTDLIVLAAVNPGAHLLADGNIHVYGPLRGRAVAGAKGAAQARIFCLRLDAEMVGIDVAYLMADDIPRSSLGKPAQIRLDAGRVMVLPL